MNFHSSVTFYGAQNKCNAELYLKHSVMNSDRKQNQEENGNIPDQKFPISWNGVFD